MRVADVLRKKIDGVLEYDRSCLYRIKIVFILRFRVTKPGLSDPLSLISEKAIHPVENKMLFT